MGDLVQLFPERRKNKTGSITIVKDQSMVDFRSILVERNKSLQKDIKDNEVLAPLLANIPEYLIEAIGLGYISATLENIIQETFVFEMT